MSKWLVDYVGVRFKSDAEFHMTAFGVQVGRDMFICDGVSWSPMCAFMDMGRGMTSSITKFHFGFYFGDSGALLVAHKFLCAVVAT